MPLGKTAIRRIFLYSTALILAMVLLSPFVIPSLLNSGAVKQRLVEEIQDATGISLLPENVRLVLMPFPGIRLQNFPVDIGHGLNVSIDSLSIELDLARLINREVSVNRVLIQNPSLKYTPAEQAQTPMALPSDIVDTIYGLLPESQGDIVLDINHITSDYFDDMDAELLVFKEDKKILLRSTIHGIDMDQARITEIAQGTVLPVSRVKIPSAELSLHLDNRGTLKGKIAVNGPAVTSSKLNKGPLKAQSLSMEFTLSNEKRYARLAPAQLTYPSASVGILFEEDKGTGKTELTFSGQRVDIDQAREVCLPLLKGIEVSDRLFDILRAGTARTISVGFKAPSLPRLFDARNLVIEGQAESARVKIPETPLIAKNVGAMVTMDKGILHIEPGQGTVAGTAIRDGVLDINLVHSHEVPFSGTFSLDARLEELPQTLAALLPGTRLAEEMPLVSGVTGTAKAVLGLSMPEGSRELAVTVRASEIRASGSYGRVPLPLKIDRGSFTLEGDKVSVEGIFGNLGKNPVENLTASVTLGDRPMLDLTSASGRFAVEELMPWIRSHPPVMALLEPAQSLAGTLILDSLSIAGPMFSPALWTFSSQGSGQDVVIGFENHPEAVDQVCGRFSLGRDKLAFSRISARVGDIGWLDFAFDKKTLSSIRLPLTISGGRIERTDQITTHGKITWPSGPEASFDLEGSTLKKMIPTLIMLKEPGLTEFLLIPYTAADKPRFSFDGRLDTRTFAKVLIPGSFLHNSLKELTGDNSVTLYTDLKSDLHLETRKLNLDILLSQKAGENAQDKKSFGESPEKNKTSRPLLAQKSLFFKIHELIFRKQTFNDVDARIQFHRDITHVDIHQAVLCGLIAGGTVDIVHGGAKPEVTTAISIQPRDTTNIADLLSCLFNTNSVINGAYTFSMTLDGQGDPDTILKQQQGILSFDARQGRIYKATILSRVLSVINILDVDIRQEGFAYKDFIVEADIKDSVLHLKKVYIDAENMAVIARGWLDPLADKMDVTFLVAPFKTIDTIIKAIPVVNTIMSGRLVSLPVKASGNISDPKVVPLAPSAVGKGLVDMLTDLVKTPVRLFQSEDPR